ncbi:ester cyclase [Microvirga sp. P5_D2]
MAEDKHEVLIRAYIDEVFNGHRVDILEKYWDDELTSHWLGMETIHGLPAWRAAMEGFFGAFPDAAYTLDDMFFAGDRGVWRGRWQATQQGEWQGIAASGRNATWTVIIIGRFAERQAEGGLGRVGPARPFPAARMRSDWDVGGLTWTSLLAASCPSSARSYFSLPRRDCLASSSRGTRPGGTWTRRCSVWSWCAGSAAR